MYVYKYVYTCVCVYKYVYLNMYIMDIMLKLSKGLFCEREARMNTRLWIRGGKLYGNACLKWLGVDDLRHGI